MIVWKKFRIPLLAFTFTSIFLTLGNVILLSKKDQSTVTSFNFPEKISLPQWQSSTIYPLRTKPTSNHPELISQKNYQYIQNNLILDVEISYLTDGDAVKFIRDNTLTLSSPVIHQQQGIGYYGFGVDQKRQAYLSACINSQGSTTFTDEQFNKNRHLHDTRPQHLLSWFLGEEQLQDRRCLWTHLSIPLKDSSPEAAYQVLEKAWFSWYQWWRPRFPKP
ncbi:MAG: cyanoexosortase A system-associated protein [Rhizonema sp. NSF051]|nr:cyanoexosortase A system-associated protein [Rhizonema sp. NSF051]